MYSLETHIAILWSQKHKPELICLHSSTFILCGILQFIKHLTHTILFLFTAFIKQVFFSPLHWIRGRQGCQICPRSHHNKYPTLVCRPRAECPSNGQQWLYRKLDGGEEKVGLKVKYGQSKSLAYLCQFLNQTIGNATRFAFSVSPLEHISQNPLPECFQVRQKVEERQT